jgi:AcrR family transcriptional regulator
MRKHRATTADQLEARRRSLVDAAASLLAQWSVEDVSMDRVADVAGVAKGTVYRYFATREELLLAVWERDQADWLAAMGELLSRSGEPASDRDIAATAVETALARPRLCRLHGIVHTVLAANLTPAAARGFTQRRLARAAAAAKLLERGADRLTAARALRWLLRLDAIMAGMLPLAAPPPTVAQALEDPRVRGLRLDVEAELRLVAAETLAALRVA